MTTICRGSSARTPPKQALTSWPDPDKVNFPTDQLPDLAFFRLHPAFLKSRPDSAAGILIFVALCRTFNSLAERGGQVGPQLDGVSHRGAERHCEDVLDANRNVDRIFRQSRVILKGGDLFSDLFRTAEGRL